MNSLRRLIAERNLTQCQLARVSGVGREQICQVSTGKRRFRYPAEIAALAWALEVSPSELEDVYRGRQPLPKEASSPKEKNGLPPDPLAEEIRRRMKALPRGSQERFLRDRSLPDPWRLLHRRRLLVRNAEDICDRLGIHPADVYGSAYYQVSA